MTKSTESYKGIGKKAKRDMIRRWKRSASGLSLKEWARQAGVGDAAESWIKAKAGNEKSHDSLLAI